MEKNFNNEIDEMDDVLNPDEIIDDTSSDINDDDIVTDEDDNEYVSKEYADKLISELKTAKEDADTDYSLGSPDGAAGTAAGRRISEIHTFYDSLSDYRI